MNDKFPIVKSINEWLSNTWMKISRCLTINHQPSTIQLKSLYFSHHFFQCSVWVDTSCQLPWLCCLCCSRCSGCLHFYCCCTHNYETTKLKYYELANASDLAGKWNWFRFPEKACDFSFFGVDRLLLLFFHFPFSIFIFVFGFRLSADGATLISSFMAGCRDPRSAIRNSRLQEPQNVSCSAANRALRGKLQPKHGGLEIVNIRRVFFNLHADNDNENDNHEDNFTFALSNNQHPTTSAGQIGSFLAFADMNTTLMVLLHWITQLDYQTKILLES